jgi:sulfoxide reductase catalytic subunit YedY
MLFKRNPNGLDLPYPSEITPQEIYTGRREFITRMAATAAVGSGVWEMANREAFAQTAGQKLAARPNVALSTDEKQTPFKDAAGYNNF